MGHEDDTLPRPPQVPGPMKHGRLFSNSVVRDAQQLFQARTGRAFSEDETRAMLARLTDFFHTLIEWDAKAHGVPSDLRQGDADSKRRITKYSQKKLTDHQRK